MADLVQTSILLTAFYGLTCTHKPQFKLPLKIEIKAKLQRLSRNLS